MSQRSVVARLAEEKGLVIVSPDALTLRRQRCGKGFSFLTKTGALVRDDGEIKRLKALAVPPAYVNVRFAADEAAHLQAVGEDAAGRLQYRYHPKWTEVREVLKARRLAGLVKALPVIRRAVARGLSADGLDRHFVTACVIELVWLTAIRAGGEEYVREHGTRGATTLLKSNVKLANIKHDLTTNTHNLGVAKKSLNSAQRELSTRLIDMTPPAIDMACISTCVAAEVSIPVTASARPVWLAMVR